MASARTQVRRERIFASLQVLESLHVCFSEIVDVNVVSNAGAVWCRVVRSEYMQLRANTSRGLKSKGNEMSLGIVQFPDVFAKAFICDGLNEAPSFPGINGIADRGSLDEIVERSLRRASIWDEVKDRLRTSALGLSGGQQQRVCIARALANQPEVLLLDEPASALDPSSTQRIEELVYELKRELTIIIVTHNLQQAARASEYTAFFFTGELVEFGPTEQLFTSPREERTEAYITGRFG